MTEEKRGRAKRDWKKEMWPEVATREGAEKAAKQGATACFITAVITAAAIVVLSFVDVGPRYSGIVDWWSFIDVAIMVVLGLLIRRNSRIAAAIALIYYVGNRIFVWVDVGVGSPMGVIIAILILLLLINGVRGTFALARMRAGGPSDAAMSEG